MRNMRLQQTQGSTLVFVDPQNFSSTLRIALNVNKKISTGKTVLNNARSEIKTSRDADVKKSGCTDACTIDSERVVITTTISGSVENQEFVNAALNDHLINLAAARPDLTIGLLPALSTNFVIGSDETNDGTSGGE